MSSHYKLIIFDWDGTLMDSLPRIVSCMQAAARDFGLPVRLEKDVHEIVGLGLAEALKRLYPSIDVAGIERMRELYAKHYMQKDAEPSQFFQGIVPMLNALEASPAWLSVATGKSRRGLDRVMRGTSSAGYFASSRCADESESKPSPRMVLELLKHHDVNPDEAIVVGDTEFDMAMARNAGVDRLGVGWGAHDLERLEKYQPKACFSQVQDLAQWLLD